MLHLISDGASLVVAMSIVNDPQVRSVRALRQSIQFTETDTILHSTYGFRNTHFVDKAIAAVAAKNAFTMNGAIAPVTLYDTPNSKTLTVNPR